MLKVKFRSLPLGARFKYNKTTDDVWVVLENWGCGKIAKWDGNILNYIGQKICIADNTEKDTDNLTVFLID